MRCFAIRRLRLALFILSYSCWSSYTRTSYYSLQMSSQALDLWQIESYLMRPQREQIRLHLVSTSSKEKTIVTSFHIQYLSVFSRSSLQRPHHDSNTTPIQITQRKNQLTKVPLSTLNNEAIPNYPSKINVKKSTPNSPSETPPKSPSSRTPHPAAASV